jgi:hypothetical protein
MIALYSSSKLTISLWARQVARPSIAPDIFEAYIPRLEKREGVVTGGRFHDRIHVHGGGAFLGNLPAGVRLHLNAGLISNFLTGFRLYLNAGLVIFFMMLSEAESQEKRCSCGSNPGIFDQNAALTPFGSTGTMKMTILSDITLQIFL